MIFGSGMLSQLPTAHAETHTVVLPHALAYNAPAIPHVMEKLRNVLGHQHPATALFELVGRIGAPRSLREIGMPADGIEVATERALANPYWNPQPLERDGIRALIAPAYAGDAPAVLPFRAETGRRMVPELSPATLGAPQA